MTRWIWALVCELAAMLLWWIPERSGHRHQCGSCGYIFSHSDECAALPTKEKIAAHACPRCGVFMSRNYRRLP